MQDLDTEKKYNSSYYLLLYKINIIFLDISIGERVICEGMIGTIRYIGPLKHIKDNKK